MEWNPENQLSYHNLNSYMQELAHMRQIPLVDTDAVD
jgi:hypothetical protein